MSAAELLADFSRRGIQLTAEGERLSYDAPAGQLQASDLEKLRSHKSELLAYLNREAANTVVVPPTMSCLRERAVLAATRPVLALSRV
jgi:hypothetical protein